MCRLVAEICLILIVSPITSVALADGPPTLLPKPNADTLRASQVSLAIADGDLFRALRGTVVEIQGQAITILTAARFIKPTDEGHVARLVLDAGVVEGLVMDVAINPAYRPRGSSDVQRRRQRYSVTYRSPFRHGGGGGYHQNYSVLNRELPGADSAIVQFWFPGSRGVEDGPIDHAFRTIQAVPAMAPAVWPGPSGGDLIARIFDGTGKEHAIRAGNYQNPRVLEWGHAYNPAPEDSGGGVFTLRRGVDGRPEPILIGVLLGPDSRGGHASLVSSSMPWVAAGLLKKGNVESPLNQSGADR